MEDYAAFNLLLAPIKSFEDLKGYIIYKIEGDVGDSELRLYFAEDRYVEMYHSQDCCEHVYIESIVGDLNDLIGEPILLAEEASRAAEVGECSESGTWTFYKLATRKGYIDIRWLGESNGYYSESVDIRVVE